MTPHVLEKNLMDAVSRIPRTNQVHADVGA